nr:DUF6318 family protein [Arthrobacter castelli]
MTPTPTSTPTPTTPEPTPASSTGPAAHIPVPEKPALADKNTKAGLKAFTKWWLELFSYGYVTNDWKKFWAVTDPGCKTCTNITGRIQEQYSPGGWMKGGTLTLVDHFTKFEENTAGSINSFARVRQDSITYFDSSGKEVGESEPVSAKLFSVIAFYHEDHWIMLDFGSPEGT